MIRPKRIDCVDLNVRGMQRALVWYDSNFGFEPQFAVRGGGTVIGRNGARVALFPVCDPENATQGYTGTQMAVRLFGFEVEEEDFERLDREFADDPDRVHMDHPRYKSMIVEDPDGHVIELTLCRDFAAGQEE